MPITTSAVRAPVHDPRPALDALSRGELIVGVDDVSGTCDLLLAARSVTTATMAAMIALGSGFVCVTVDSDIAHDLLLPPMTWESQPGSFAGQMGVSIDAVDGTTTGISAHDRARTVRALCAENSGPGSFTRPGHVVPVLVPDQPTGDQRTPIIAKAGRLAQVLGHTTAPDSPTSGVNSAKRSAAVVFSSLVSLRDGREIAGAHEAADFGMPVLHYASLALRTSSPGSHRFFPPYQEMSFDDHYNPGSPVRVS